MRILSRVVCVALLLGLGVSAGFGWGTVTHVYFANHLGVMFGPLNQNEIYGATLPDLFGYSFGDIPALTVDYGLHTDKSLLWSLYHEAQSREAKAAFYGVFTHNNVAPEGWKSVSGADWYAHGVYPGNEQGWVIRQGLKLVSNPEIAGYIVGLVGEENFESFAPVVGHTLIETAVDILVKRNLDPLVGARLYFAAKNRTEEVPLVLKKVLGGMYPGVEEVEAYNKEQTMGYGQLFLMPEDQLIGAISGQTATVAMLYITKQLGLPAPEGGIDANVIAQFIGMAIKQVQPIYRMELMATLARVAFNMRNGPPPAGPIFAFCKDEEMESVVQKAGLSVEQPTDFALGQNYPNPFNPSTNISYSLPADAHVSLKVYNSLGQEVASLVDEARPAGQYVAVWNAAGMASGIYFYRLQAGSYIETKRMTLLK